VAAALGVPIVVTNERPERNGPTAPEIATRIPAGARVFAKTSFDLSGQSDIRNAIERTDRSTVVLIGMETDVCVAQSAIGLVDHDFRVAAVIDATYSPGEGHSHGLDRMRGVAVTLVSAKGLFYEWVPSLPDLSGFKHAYPDLARPEGIQL
jgi:nicotinamidase-related amidase